MDAGPDDVQLSADLGPISPELVLIDPVLADRARRLLPDPAEPPPRERLPVAATEAVPSEPVAPPPRRRRGRTLVLAGLVFAAGAVSGNFLAERHATAPSGMTFEAQVDAVTTTSTRARTEKAVSQGTSTNRTRRTSAGRARPAGAVPRHVRKHRVVTRTKRRARTPALQRRRPAARRAVRWAANVLGVTTHVASRGVRIAWKRPANSSRVVVLRALGARRRGLVVFRGRATSYRDVSPRPCTAYRYTIVNYDHRGHRSTGVPTSVVTAGCIY